MLQKIILVGKLERKRPFGTHRQRWEDNIKMDINWIHQPRTGSSGRFLRTFRFHSGLTDQLSSY
jgi:hypothetical protein